MLGLVYIIFGKTFEINCKFTFSLKFNIDFILLHHIYKKNLNRRLDFKLTREEETDFILQLSYIIHGAISR